MWAFGPRRCGPNILINRVPGLNVKSVFQTEDSEVTSAASTISSTPASSTEQTLSRMVNNSVVNGFQLATSAGPLCAEPLMGVCFMLEDIKIEEWDTNKGQWLL